MATSAAIRQHLVDALGLDLIGPSWHNVARRHEQLSQPPSVWYTTGFLVPHVFEQEAGRTPHHRLPRSLPPPPLCDGQRPRSRPCSPISRALA